MGKQKGKNKKISIYVLLIGILSIIYGIYQDNLDQAFGFPDDSSSSVQTNLKVYYLDVGQADAILIQNQDESMLIDAGNNEDGPLLVSYFKSLGISSFKYVVGTHPHEDHIGGLDDVIRNFDITTIYMPDVITTTATFVDVLEAIENKQLTYTVPQIGEEFSLGEAILKVIYTGVDTSDLNNTSIVLKLTFGNTSFLFTGDATGDTEKKILDQNIQADVLKVGHHGSNTSTTEQFLDKVNPRYAIISVGLYNHYGHPGVTTLQKLEARQVEIHRTDEEGTVLVTSDGKNIYAESIQTNTNGG